MCLATKLSFVHFVNRAGATSVSVNMYCHHQIQKCHYALWTPFTIVMFRRLNVELVQSYDCFFCVSNYIVMKDNDLNYFPCFEEKNIFLYTAVFFFSFGKKKNSIVHFISLIVVFFTEKILWLKLFHVSL